MDWHRWERRTARSLASMLSAYPGVSFVFVAPEVVKMKDDVKKMQDGDNDEDVLK